MNIEKVSSELYERLFLLRYPGVAQATTKNAQETVLTSENRLFLLSWLLAQISLVDCHEFLNNSNESKVVQWYAEMGIYNDPEVLMGRVPITDQIVALRNLLLFVKSVLRVAEPLETAGDRANPVDLYKKYVDEVSPVPSNLRPSQKLTYNEAVRYLNGCRDSLTDKAACTEVPSDAIVENSSLDELHGPPENPEASNDSERKARVNKFVESFETASTWPRPESSDSMSIPATRMDPCIDSVHSNMTTLKETIESKRAISNSVMMKPLEHRPMPLDVTIEDIVIGIEELGRLQNSE